MFNEPGCAQKQPKEHPPTPLLYEQEPAPRSGVFVRRKNTRTRTPHAHGVTHATVCRVFGASFKGVSIIVQRVT